MLSLLLYFNSQISYLQGIQPPELKDRDREQNKPPHSSAENSNLLLHLNKPMSWMGSTQECLGSWQN